MRRTGRSQRPTEVNYAKPIVKSIRKRYTVSDEQEKDLYNSINKLLNDFSKNRDTYDLYYEKLKKILNKYEKREKSTNDQDRVNVIANLLDIFNPSSILDINGGDINTTIALANHYNIKKEQTFVLSNDVKDPRVTSLKPNTNFKIPLDDNSINMVLFFDVIHHMNKTKGLIEEINRVLIPGGRIVVREHDSTDPDDVMYPTFIDILHMVKYISKDEEVESMNYYHRQDVSDILKRFQSINFLRYSEPNPQRLYYEVFMKKGKVPLDRRAEILLRKSRAPVTSNNFIDVYDFPNVEEKITIEYDNKPIYVLDSNKELLYGILFTYNFIHGTGLRFYSSIENIEINVGTILKFYDSKVSKEYRMVMDMDKDHSIIEFETPNFVAGVLLIREIFNLNEFYKIEGLKNGKYLPMEIVL